MRLVLIGAGGHAKSVVEALLLRGDQVSAYVDPHPSGWSTGHHICEDDPAVVREAGDAIVMGLGGIHPDGLIRRLALLDRYLEAGLNSPHVVHPSAHVSENAVLGDGVIVLANAVIQPGAEIGRGAIINSGAIIEHDTSVGAGSHVAPGAIVLGECRTGDCAMIGAGAVILPGSTVEAETLVPAASKHPR